jgi:hypothetical protein
MRDLVQAALHAQDNAHDRCDFTKTAYSAENRIRFLKNVYRFGLHGGIHRMDPSQLTTWRILCKHFQKSGSFGCRKSLATLGRTHRFLR